MDHREERAILIQDVVDYVNKNISLEKGLTITISITNLPDVNDKFDGYDVNMSASDGSWRTVFSRGLAWS